MKSIIIPIAIFLLILSALFAKTRKNIPIDPCDKLVHDIMIIDKKLHDDKSIKDYQNELNKFAARDKLNIIKNRYLSTLYKFAKDNNKDNKNNNKKQTLNKVKPIDLSQSLDFLIKFLDPDYSNSEIPVNVTVALNEFNNILNQYTSSKKERKREIKKLQKLLKKEVKLNQLKQIKSGKKTATEIIEKDNNNIKYEYAQFEHHFGPIDNYFNLISDNNSSISDHNIVMEHFKIATTTNEGEWNENIQIKDLHKKINDKFNCNSFSVDKNFDPKIMIKCIKPIVKYRSKLKKSIGDQKKILHKKYWPIYNLLRIRELLKAKAKSSELECHGDLGANYSCLQKNAPINKLARMIEGIDDTFKTNSTNSENLDTEGINFNKNRYLIDLKIKCDHDNVKKLDLISCNPENLPKDSISTDSSNRSIRTDPENISEQIDARKKEKRDKKRVSKRRKWKKTTEDRNNFIARQRALHAKNIPNYDKNGNVFFSKGREKVGFWGTLSNSLASQALGDPQVVELGMEAVTELKKEQYKLMALDAMQKKQWYTKTLPEIERVEQVMRTDWINKFWFPPEYDSTATTQTYFPISAYTSTTFNSPNFPQPSTPYNL